MTSGFHIRQPRSGRCTPGQWLALPNLLLVHPLELSHRTENEPEDCGRASIASLPFYEKCDPGLALSNILRYMGSTATVINCDATFYAALRYYLNAC